MAQFILRDLPGDLWQHAITRAQLEGWPIQDLVLALLQDYVSGTVTPTMQPPRPPAPTTGPVVAIRFTCPKCNKMMEVESRHSEGFGMMRFERVRCPHCSQVTERMLPGGVVSVRALAKKP